MADRNNDEKTMTDRGIEHSIKGKANQLKGKLKDAAGGLTGDNQLQAEGKWDQMKGKLQDAAGKVERKLGRDDDTP